MAATWENIRSRVAEELDPGQYKVWIAPLAGSVAEDVVELRAINEFVAGFVRNRFAEIIARAASDELGKVTTVSIGVGSASIPVSGAASLEVVTEPNEPQPEPMEAPAVARSGGSSVATQGYLPLSFTPAPSQAMRAWRHSFDSFVVGPSNELAFAAARSICQSASAADVLFLSSASGLGKTHLIQAVGKGLFDASNRSLPRVEYLTAEEFVSRLHLAIKTNDTDSFKARYRGVDVLLLEDVHFMQGKEKMQDELLATVKSLQDRGSKVVFSSSFVPRDLKGINDSLVSRLGSGFLAVIDKPDFEMRRRILQEKARLFQVLLPPDVTELLAEHISSDVRQIESCLRNLVLKARLLNSGITMQMAWDTLEHYTVREKRLDLESIIRQVCQGYGISSDQMLSKSRKKELVNARNTAFYLARKHTDLSLEQIGSRFNRTHSTVIKGITSLEREISRESSLGRQMAGTIAIIERSGGILTAYH